VPFPEEIPVRLATSVGSLAIAATILLLVGGAAPARALPVVYDLEFTGSGESLAGSFTVEDWAPGYGVADATVVLSSFTIEHSSAGITWTEDDRPAGGTATALNDSSGGIVGVDISYFDTVSNWQLELDPTGSWTLFTFAMPTGSYELAVGPSPMPEPRATLCFLLGLAVVALFLRGRVSV
jgi:hypothetical protein